MIIIGCCVNPHGQTMIAPSLFGNIYISFLPTNHCCVFGATGTSSGCTNSQSVFLVC
jgi:hypothetical protein